MTDKNAITTRLAQTQVDQTQQQAPQKEGFLNINENQEKLCIARGQKVCIHPGAKVTNCYVFGGYLEVHAGAQIRNCIINSGEVCLFSGSKTSNLLAKEGCTLTIRTNAKIVYYRQTGPITFSMYPGNRLNAPLNNKDAHAQ